MSEQAPRINAPLLEQFQSRIVRVVGKVVELRGDRAVIDSRGAITVFLDRVYDFLLCIPGEYLLTKRVYNRIAILLLVTLQNWWGRSSLILLLKC